MNARKTIDNSFRQPIAKQGESVRLTWLWADPIGGFGKIPNQALLLRRYREFKDNTGHHHYGTVTYSDVEKHGELPVVSVRLDKPIAPSRYLTQEVVQLFRLVNMDSHIYFDETSCTVYWVEPGMARERVGHMLDDE